MAPELLCKPPSREAGGRRECRVRSAPAAACAKKAHALATTGTPHQPAFPARWFYGLYRALPGDRALLPPSFADSTRDLNASVGASGPHDFAVRIGAARPA